MKQFINDDESIVHYEIDSKKGRIDLFFETDDEGDSFFIIKDFNGRLFLITDFEQFKKVLEYYEN